MTGRFQPGNPGGGRLHGARNRLSTDFLENLAADFAEHGPGVIRMARTERPIEYLKIVASTLPREFEITRLRDLSDEELDGLITELRRQIANTPSLGDAERGEDSSIH